MAKKVFVTEVDELSGREQSLIQTDWKFVTDTESGMCVRTRISHSQHIRFLFAVLNIKHKYTDPCNHKVLCTGKKDPI